MSEETKFEQWAIVDVMGHQRYIGLVTEQVIAGQGFVRIDVPANADIPAWTKIVGTGSIYAITPVSEEIARGMASTHFQRPVTPYELTEALRDKMLPAPAPVVEPEYDDEDDGWGL